MHSLLRNNRCHIISNTASLLESCQLTGTLLQSSSGCHSVRWELLLTGSFTKCTKAFRQLELMIQLFTKQSTSSGQITAINSFQMYLISSKPVEIACSTQVVVVFPGTLYMWNNRKYLLWQHIVDVYRYDLDTPRKSLVQECLCL